MSAFSGGFFAGLWTYHFQYKQNIKERKLQKYIEHRNSLVQIEQELIPLRINMSRNISSIKGAIENTNTDNIRLVLRFFRLNLAHDFGLKLLNLDLINLYADFLIRINTLNSDFDYIDSMIKQIMKGPKSGIAFPSLLDGYRSMITYLNEKCIEVDKLSLDIDSMCKIILSRDDKKIKENYLKNNSEIKYIIEKNELNIQKNKILAEELRKPRKNEKSPNFFAPYFDLKKVVASK